MPDITMCENDECPLKEKCYRYKARPSYHQIYALFKYDYEKKECEHFIKFLEDKKVKNPKKALDKMVKLNQEMGLYEDKGDWKRPQ